MATGSILLGIALFFLTSLFVARPFLRPGVKENELTEYQLLLEEKEHLLDHIQALDFDHDTGKLPTDLYQFQRGKLMEQATAVLKAIDQAGGEPAPPKAAAVSLDDSVDVDIEIEAAVARLRRQRTHDAGSTMVVTNGQARFCSQCGTPTDPGDKFCTQCGHKLILESSTKTA